MRILVAPGAFKGSMTADQAADHLASMMQPLYPGAEFVLMPMADGGDGTVDVLLAHGWESTRLQAADALGRARAVTAAKHGDLIALELASICGMHTIDALAPRAASSLGLGLAMRAAMNAGANELLIGLGGSASTDGGLGLIKGVMGERACGGLEELIAVTTSRALSRNDLPAIGIPITVLCDVDNPLIGPRGAAKTFGPQKGLDAAGREEAESALTLWASDLGVDPSTPGAGAAGGVGAALLALGAAITPGGSRIAEVIGLAKILKSVDLVVTGEGRLDTSTLSGKAPGAVARLAQSAGVPCVIVTGSAQDGVADALGARLMLLPDL